MLHKCIYFDLRPSRCHVALYHALSRIKADERRSGNEEVRRKLDAFGKLQHQCNSIHFNRLRTTV